MERGGGVNWKRVRICFRLEKSIYGKEGNALKAGCLVLQYFLDFIVQHQYESTAGTTEDVGEGTLEEGTGTLLLGDSGPAMQCALVDDLGRGTARLHHHATTDSIEGIGYDTGDSGDDLCNSPADIPRGGLGVWQHTTSSVVETEVGSTVDDDTLDRYTETTVQTDEAVRLIDLGKTVAQTLELTLSSALLTDISCQTGTGEIKRVDEAQRGGTGQTTGGQVTDEVAHELGVLVDATEEDLLVLVLEGEVQCLCREVPDDVGHVTTPVGTKALLPGNAHEAVDHTLVAVGLGDLLGDVLDLKQQLDTLDGGHGGLGDGRRDTAGGEILQEGNWIC